MTYELKIKSVIGHSGKVAGALKYSPCGKFIVYPLGSFVVLKHIRSEREAFLDGHSMDVTCIDISQDAKKIVSGQLQLHGVKASVHIWDFQLAKQLLEQGNVMIGSSCLLHQLKQHVGKVQSVSLSPHSNYLCTLGGQDDNNVVVWNVENGLPICGCPAASDSGLACSWLHSRNDRFVTAGYYHVRVWQVDFQAPKLYPVDTKLGTLRRVFNCIDITKDDHIAFLGTTTGDLIKVKIDRDDIRSFNDPEAVVPTVLGVSKDRLSMGINAVCIAVNPSSGNYNVIVGGGDGTISYMNPNLGLVKSNTNNLNGGITAIKESSSTGTITVVTDLCNRYELSRDLLKAELKSSSHFGSVHDVSFPQNCPDIIVTSSKGDIRVWNIFRKQELLRIQVPNIDCLCSLVSPTGSLIVSGWEDGKIRAFLPESGKQQFTIGDAHDKVTSLAVIDNDDSTSASWRLISGGAEGKVRIWSITATHQILLSSLKEHRGSINCLKVNADRTQCVSASSDGSCIVWDLNRYIRLTALFETNKFQSVVYHPDQSQYMTCGSNHQITYWDASRSEAIRVIPGGNGVMTALDIDPIEGEYVVSGCEDRLVKVWHYDDGETVAVGRGHSGTINAVKISPDYKCVVSVGTSGEIILWELPAIREMHNTSAARK